MLNKHSRKTLDTICKSKPDGPKGYYSIKHLENILDEQYYSLQATIRFLESQGYISYYKIENQLFGIFVEEKGMYHAEFARIKAKEFLFKSILVPIVISVTTALLTLHITT